MSSPASLGERFVLKIREDAAVAEGYAPDAGDHGCNKKKRHAVAAISAASQAYDELANALSERDIMDPHTDEDLRKKRDAEEAASTARRAYAELEESLLKRKLVLIWSKWKLAKRGYTKIHWLAET